ncbi:Abi family protein [Curtobacterium sp. 'Ferrero']|uniref:Abi family protein n=1 Tax=Curtobacterium sp. 'Ferrero' TaxID=2033654 RepID=UPI00159690EA|nr:Abi family protein [Curtobacterium sp. 'Ferrero']
MSKPARTIAEQIDLLESRGLRLGAGERNRLARLLMSHGYYRLSGYWRYFQVAPHLGDDRFRPDATLDDIESPTSYLRRNAYCAQVVARDGQIVELRDELLLDVRRELRRSKEDFIAHHTRRGVPVPVWAAVEALTFGAVSKIHRLIDDGDVRYSVAKSFGLDPKRTESAVRALAVLQNVCAHHGRLWNRVPTVPLQVPRPLQRDPDRSIYRQTMWGLIVTLASLVDGIRRDSGYSESLLDLVDRHPVWQDGLKRPHRR